MHKESKTQWYQDISKARTDTSKNKIKEVKIVNKTPEPNKIWKPPPEPLFSDRTLEQMRANQTQAQIYKVWKKAPLIPAPDFELLTETFQMTIKDIVRIRPASSALISLQTGSLRKNKPVGEYTQETTTEYSYIRKLQPLDEEYIPNYNEFREFVRRTWEDIEYNRRLLYQEFLDRARYNEQTRLWFEN